MILDSGQPQSLEAILEGRQWREDAQRSLMDEFPESTVVAIKLNTPGAIKTNAALRAIFRAGLAEFADRAQDEGFCDERWHVYISRATGPEAFVVYKDDWRWVKAVAVRFEDASAMGRLFDIDVMRHGQVGQLSRTDLGMPQRRCLVCSRPAKECARSQTHSAQELKEAVERRYLDYCGTAARRLRCAAKLSGDRAGRASVDGANPALTEEFGHV